MYHQWVHQSGRWKVSLNEAGSNSFGIITIINTEKQKMESDETRAVFCSPYFPRQQNETRTRRVLECLVRSFGPFEAKCVWQSCHRGVTMTNVSLLQDYFWHRKREGCCVSGRGDTDGAIASQPHEWLMSVRGDFTPFPYTAFQSVRSGSLGLCLSGPLLSYRQTPEKARLVLSCSFWKARTLGWWIKKKEGKSERQLGFWTLSVSHSAGGHTQVCWSPWKKWFFLLLLFKYNVFKEKERNFEESIKAACKLTHKPLQHDGPWRRNK